MKVSIDDVIAQLKSESVAPATILKITTKLKQAVEEEKADREPSTVKSKSQFVFVAADDNEVLKNIDLVGFVLQLEESASPAVTLDRIKAAATAYNNSRKGKRYPVSKLADAMSIPRKFWKSESNPTEKTLLKTKEPVLLLSTTNKL